MLDHAPGLKGVVDKYFTRFERSGWNRFTAFDWAALDASKLTDLQVGAVRTAQLIEDHIPSYTSEYFRLFPLHSDLAPEVLEYRRQLVRFVSRWTADEDRHAHTLENYLRNCGQVDIDELEKEMAETIVRPYTAPAEHSLPLAVYTSVQEKATQLFYGCLGAASEEPVLKSVMAELNADEARHCGFFVDLLRLHLADATSEDIRAMKEVVDEFGMPLADVVTNYRRRSIKMMRAAPGYDFRSAFEILERALRGFAEAKTDSRTNGLADLLKAVEAIRPPAPKPQLVAA